MTAITPRADDGFVRVPQQYIHLPITPQAKTLLMIFCAHADDSGKSWCSYSQIGELLQRSKASVSSYVRELQAAGLIHCKQQRYGNGFNYRLLITLVGWKDLLAHWAQLRAKKKQRSDDAASPTPTCRGRDADAPEKHHTTKPAQTSKQPLSEKSAAKTAKSAERRVRRAEHKDPSGPINQIHQTQTPKVVWTEEDEIAWRKFRPRDEDLPSAVHGTPSPDLLRKAIAHFEHAGKELDYLEPSEANRIAKEELTRFATARRLEATEEQLHEAAKTIAGTARTPEAIEAALGALSEAWMPHWRRLSTPKQIEETCAAAIEAALPPKEVRVRAWRASQRAWLAKVHLNRRR